MSIASLPRLENMGSVKTPRGACSFAYSLCKHLLSTTDRAGTFCLKQWKSNSHWSVPENNTEFLTVSQRMQMLIAGPWYLTQAFPEQWVLAHPLPAYLMVLCYLFLSKKKPIQGVLLGSASRFWFILFCWGRALIVAQTDQERGNPSISNASSAEIADLCIPRRERGIVTNKWMSKVAHGT